MASFRKQDALDYHSQGKPGKIEVIPTKPYSTQRDLTLAYSPGVAEPCLEIAAQPDDVYKYTAKGNLVAVISNGTAVLGLGDIGPLADDFVNTVKDIAPTFGGINLEDIKAPECFEIERRLKEELNIPLMHDDQHGTAIISSAALLNAVELSGKKMEDIRVVVNGAGASANSCSRMYMAVGVKRENLIMLDSKGVIHKNRKDLDAQKQFFASDRTDINTLDEAIKNADVFVGLSKGNILSQDMVRSMNNNCIVFALANPTPEISYEDAIASRPDIIVATGRSDHPNQVNNVLGFPFIFRGALDVRATTINEEMKLAAVLALSQLAKEPVPEMVNLAYGIKNLSYGPEYIIPKPVDARLISTISPAVAKAAIDSGVAQKKITDWEAYKQSLDNRLGQDNKFMRNMANKAKTNPKRIVFTEGDNYKTLKAVQVLRDEGIAKPVLLGKKDKILSLIQENNIDLGDTQIIDTYLDEQEDLRLEFADILWKKRQRRGLTLFEAQRLMRDRNYFGAMMVETGVVDAMISGLTRKYPIPIKPSIEIIGVQPGVSKLAGLYILSTKKGIFFLADTTMNADPTAEELADLAVLTANTVRQFNIMPRIAMLSYSNFGSTEGEVPKKVAKAVDILHKNYPGMIVDGDLQANFAVNNEMLKEQFAFSYLVDKSVNTLIFPNLASGNIAYKLLQELGGAEAIGPVLMGLNKTVHVLQLGSSVREIVNMATIAVVDAQNKTKK
jgi:malate dehydrogenase (oxaloacetate-decarboxylating)(NADP+)